ncbi:bifunctional DNA-binding transcriptional regulator/O6-methylguanine-DNA methyltransferase Ada [Salinisphaera sp. Q1T1-3]|uniref:bifunctional DNA-binding transcriptional regulator/O6-methylguanine-DNA methyltransferase Ada n=1 Tax=Salinisphaera sp. Q1T1-3 TaxID=2321229 RepID=UPI000E76434A|nr:bifunctional DNA-binding transcriptional regulator/O6-methylguanine-DNA methyltransferase Ada [Salinisphaera sp. Q1T1-3]RJS94622.1 bifunctional DNA-binding transcriptional regulator/O6-methylguanine-DNA methyltransferase Ada [Salinisphaera sp. Q1T1-3]
MSEQQDVDRWASVLGNDAQADGKFLYAVKTTGIYCRPSCRSRPPRRENVVFFASVEEAKHAGFRPCKRCRPDGLPRSADKADRIARACRLIQESEKAPQLSVLAEQAGMSRFHFHRLFKQAVGMTPRQYAIACRDERVRAALADGQRVTDAVFGAGYESSGHFYAVGSRSLGMAPESYRSQGADHVIRFAIGETRLGAILVAGTTRGICAITMCDDPDVLIKQLQDSFACAELIGGDPEFEAHVAAVVGFVERPANGLDLPLDIQGTVFQQRVWRALQQIPCGETASYTEIAERIGAPKAARAVARSCASNLLAIAIPCHRVVRSDGELSGYRWGIARKRDLLDREAKSAVSSREQTTAAD